MYAIRSYYAPVRQGMELAAELHNRDHPAVELLFRDAGNSAEETGRVVTDLAAKPEVMGIVGPLTGGAAAVAAGQAQQLQIPLLSLSPREGVANIGNFIFRDSLTSRQQVSTLVHYAMEQQGLTTFAILHPETKLGYEMADLFAQEVQSRGGRIVITQSYPDTSYNFV